VICHYDSTQSVLHSANNPKFHAWTKHIDVPYQCVCEIIYDGLIQLQKIPTNENIANSLTKPEQE
jgi:hypothetical protein